MEHRTVIAQHPPRDGRQWDCQCARCGSSVMWEDCVDCDEGYSDHECGDDCCCCLEPEPNVECDICDGHGGWRTCLSSPEWCKANPLEGREQVERGEIEWFEVDEDDGRTSR